MKTDKILIEVTENGVIKVETPGSISAANHTNAEGFLRAISKDAGGETSRKHRHGKMTHSHSHHHGEQHKH